jgi:hypothetical protein
MPSSLLGVKIQIASIGMESEKDEHGHHISGGFTMFAGAEPDRLHKNRQGRVILAAGNLASRLTRDFKFEWHIEQQQGFDSDEAQLESLNDESVVKEAGLILTFLFSHGTVDAIEAVAAILNEKKGISGSEIRAIVDSEWSELDRGQFSRKEEAARRWKKGFPNYVIIDPISKRIKGPKVGYPLVCRAFVGDDPLWGKDIPCNHYPFIPGSGWELRVRLDPFIPNE